MKLLKIGITHGDINGIGYELLIKVLQTPELLEVCTPVVFGSPSICNATAQQLGIEPLPLNVIGNAEEAIDGHINMVHVCPNDEPELQFGQQTEAALRAEAQSLTAALEAYSQHHIHALIALPGHLDNDDHQHALTDFIHQAFGSQQDSFDWVCNGPLRTLILHQMDVSTELGEGLASEAFINHITAISSHLRLDFGILRPRLAVISPSNPRLRADIEELQEHGITVFGPLSPQEFTEGKWQYHYDGCILLDADDVRDQLLKDEDADHTVGYVSGLPIVLTYPLHDIGYAQAGKGQADEVPLRQAIYAAIDISRTRHSYYAATRHPLERQWVPRGRDDFKLDLTKEE